MLLRFVASSPKPVAPAVHYCLPDLEYVDSASFVFAAPTEMPTSRSFG